MLRRAAVMFTPRLRAVPSRCYSPNVIEDEADRTKMTPALTGERAVNKVTLLGRVGRNPEARGSEERPVTLLSLATSNSFKRDDGSYKQYTDWHRIAIFRPVLRDLVLNTIKQGDRIFVSGAIRYGTYVDKTGNTQHSATIIAEDVVFLTSPARREEDYRTMEDETSRKNDDSSTMEDESSTHSKMY